MDRTRLARLALGSALCLVAAGCQSISDSITSPSRWLADSSQAIADSSGAIADSSNNASQSVSGSSSPDETPPPAESAYRDDVRVTARTFAASDAPDDALLRELSRVAERHGVSHWQGRAGTWLALGAGLREAGVTRADAEALSGRLGVDAAERALLLDGYAATL